MVACSAARWTGRVETNLTETKQTCAGVIFLYRYYRVRAPTLSQLILTTGLLRGLGARQVSLLARRLAGGTREAPGSPHKRARTLRAREREPARGGLLRDRPEEFPPCWSFGEVVFESKCRKRSFLQGQRRKLDVRSRWMFSASSFRSSRHPSPISSENKLKSALL